QRPLKPPLMASRTRGISNDAHVTGKIIHSRNATIREHATSFASMFAMNFASMFATNFASMFAGFDSVAMWVRREKASFFSGCDSHLATVAPASSNRSGGGGNEIAEAFDGKDRFSGSASRQAVT